LSVFFVPRRFHPGGDRLDFLLMVTQLSAQEQVGVCIDASDHPLSFA
jgi:hypothetical protein